MIESITIGECTFPVRHATNPRPVTDGYGNSAIEWGIECESSDGAALPPLYGSFILQVVGSVPSGSLLVKYEASCEEISKHEYIRKTYGQCYVFFRFLIFGVIS